MIFLDRHAFKAVAAEAACDFVSENMRRNRRARSTAYGNLGTGIRAFNICANIPVP